MNKKFFGFLLAVAAFFSVCTLESCKDTSSDLDKEVLIKQNAQYKDLLARLDALKAELEAKMCTVNCQDVEAKVIDLLGRLAKVEEELAKLDGKYVDNDELAQALENQKLVIIEMLKVYVTKDELTQILENYATNEDLKNLVTKDQLEAALSVLENYVTKDELTTILSAYQDADSLLLLQIKALEEKINQLGSNPYDDTAIWAAIEELKNRQQNPYDDTELRELIANLQNQVNNLPEAKDWTEEINKLTSDLNSLSSAFETQTQLFNEQLTSIDEILNGKKDAEGNVIEEGLVDQLKTLSDKMDMMENYYIPELQRGLTEVVRILDDLKPRVSSLENRIEELESRVNGLEDDLKELANQVRSITVQSVYTGAVHGGINTPFGINSNILLAYYPNFDAVSFNNQFVEGGFSEENPGDAGTIYLTVDPVNVDFTGLTPELVNSQGETVGVQLSPLAKSDKVINLGVNTRAGNYLYETKATVNDRGALQQVALDKTGFKDAVKDVLSVKDGIDFSKIAGLVLSTLNKEFSANAVALEKNGDIVVSKYEIAATAVTPLNLEQTGALLQKVEDKIDFEERMSKLIAKIDDINIPGNKTTHIIAADDPSWEGMDVTVMLLTEGQLNSLNHIKDIVAKMLDIVYAKGTPVMDRLAHAANPAVFCLDGDILRVLRSGEGVVNYVNHDNVYVFPTSYSLETIVPFYKKAWDGADFDAPMMVPTGTHKYKVLDYSGNTDYRVYNIVKK